MLTGLIGTRIGRHEGPTSFTRSSGLGGCFACASASQHEGRSALPSDEEQAPPARNRPAPRSRFGGKQQ